MSFLKKFAICSMSSPDLCGASEKIYPGKDGHITSKLKSSSDFPVRRGITL